MNIKVSSLSDEQRKIKRENGVSSSLFYNRVNWNNWTIDKAISTKPRKAKSKLATAAEEEYMSERGITHSIFSYRISKGWTRKDAMSVPVEKRYRYIAYANDLEVASGKDYEVAEALGLKLNTFNYYCTESYKSRFKNPTIEIDKYTVDEFNELNNIDGGM